FTSPPTAFGGRLFVDGSGSGGTLYALDEADGSILWNQGIENGDHTSPAVGGGGVYVSPVCLWVYKFDPITGALIWSYSGDCSGGGGKTPAYSRNRLYVRDPVSSPPGWVFDSRNGNVLLNFSV